MGESVLESDQGAEDFTGFSDGENEDFVNEEEIENETDPETQVFADDEGVAESGNVEMILLTRLPEMILMDIH